jgi:hypothetical protein
VRFIDPDLVEDALYTGAYEEDPDSLTLYALAIARRCFPALYCELVEGLRAGWDFHQGEAAFSAGIRRTYPYIELESLYDLVYGVPLPFAGLDVTTPGFLDEHAGYAALLTDYFDLQPVTVPATRWREACPFIDESGFDAARPIMERLVRSLIAEDRQPFADLAFLLMYLFSCTGNNLLDFSLDAYCEAGFEPLEWEPESLGMANEACWETVIVLDAAERAMQLLAEDEAISNALKANIAALKAAGRKEDVCDNIALYWPEGHQAGGVESGAPGDTGPELALLLLRDCYAETD